MKALLGVGVALAAALGGACAKRPACREGQEAASVRSAPSAVAGQRIHAHAHNDYEHPHPLQDALDQRFSSVEADVYFDGGSFKVAHNSWDASKGSLKELYLDPLQARVDAGGSVYGDGEPFTLWIDIKDSNPAMPDALRGLLDGFSMLSRFTDQGTTPGPVTAVLTGDAGMKAALVAAPDRRAVRDSNDYAPDDPPADGRWGFYALSWGDYLGWGGSGELPEEDRARMACIMDNAHASGRKVRFYATPDRAEDWQAELANGTDYINTDHLAELSAVLASAP
ncbi:MAG TPA: hypothetical protein VFA20_15095 [Myxococcaceae bacterium]|nr:hypothetical protein [Myxococcaceae bacterium]